VIGTGLAIQLPIFSRFNRPAIATAAAARAAAEARLRAAVHGARQEVHTAFATLQRAEAQVAFNQAELAPRLEDMLRLTRASIEAGEATPLEVLIAQGQVIETKLDFLAARQRRAEAWVELQAASGRLLPKLAATRPRQGDDEEDPPDLDGFGGTDDEATEDDDAR
jgi:outer membrane protein TolC